MVLPKDKLQTKLSHIGMHLGRKLIKIETVNQHGVQVLHGIAEVDQPRTAYIFTGQGSQEVKMGMDLYESSSTAKAIWDHADSHFFNKYGFSILDIVRNNPKSLTVYFGGPLGQAIKRNYQSMVYERVGKDGNVTTTSLFPTIDDATTSHTFVSPNGLLFATQFTQPALTLMEMAIYEDMKHRGLAGPGSIFAGHSLGEYAALASVGEVLSIETLCDIVFYRGLTMQVAVPRNEEGKSEYGMIAVNPGRVGPTFTDNFLRLLVPQIASFTHRLLEIVNYNVEDFQYVVAGELIALEILSNVLNYISKSKLDIGKLVKDLGTDKLKLKLDAIINEINNDSLNRRKNGESFELQRGIATIPLVGIDVPFHSSFLLGGVPSFRKCLDQKIKTVNVDASILRGKYVPNLTGVPFDTSLEYINLVLKHCNSEVLKDIANHWNESNFATAADVQLLARTILIELLAFQFASPVRWIETQDEIFKTFAIERLIEIGPSPVLIGMAERTLKIKYQEYDDALNQTRTLWSYAKNRAEINYEQINTNSSVESTSAPVEAAPVAVVHVVHAPLPPAPVLGASTAAPSKRYE
jgi:fatty acid synthase subunit beta